MKFDSLLNSQQFFELKLQPVLQNGEYRSMKVKYQLTSDGAGGFIGDEYLILRGLAISSPTGFEPYTLRMADQDDPKRIADFLYKVSTGRLHPSCYQYLLSIMTQHEIKTGRRPGFPALREVPNQPEKPTAAENMAKEFDINLAQDEDVLRVAKKVDFDTSRVEKILAERPHLLEDK